MSLLYISIFQYISVDMEPGYSLSYEAAIQPLTMANYDQVRNINIRLHMLIIIPDAVQIVYGDMKNTGSVAVTLRLSLQNET